jgi:hypothetical protein
MTVELDHVFVFCAVGAPEAAILADRGLLEGSDNTHPGQGTANRRFFFPNAYLELLWVANPEEAQSPAVLPTGLWHRWTRRKTTSCPFGLVFRPRPGSAPVAPFSTWSYEPPYLPIGLSIQVGSGVGLAEPQLFYLPFAKRPAKPHPEPTKHPAGIREIVGVAVSLPGQQQTSKAVQALVNGGLLTVRSGPEYKLELSFTGDRSSSIDFRPGLPLLFSPQGAAA